MRTFWGAVTEVLDLGVVAEYCPRCDRLVPCLLRTVGRGDYIFFMQVAAPTRESSCLCTECLNAFPGQPQWRYAAVVPINEAKVLPVPELLAKTNPVLADRLQFKEQIGALGGDVRFAAMYEQLEAMRPGVLRSGLLRQLLDWERLAEERRTLLVEQIGARARAWQFAQRLAPDFPEAAGCLTLGVAALLVIPLIGLVPALQDWLWGLITLAAGLLFATLTDHWLTSQRIRKWTRKVLIPEAQDAGIPLDSFVAVIDDVPASRLGATDDLWPMKDELDTIRQVLRGEGKL